MSHQLSFTELVNYDASQPSITVPVTLSVSQARVQCDAKVDTGSSNCIFARNLGEELGLDIETGLRLLVGTVTGKFVAYLHEIYRSLLLSLAAWSALLISAQCLGTPGFIEQMTLGLVDY